MAFANPERKEKSINKKTVKKNNPNIRDILIDPNKIDHHKTFSEEIPDEFKYTGIHGRLGKLKFWDKSARDRWSIRHRLSWDKIPEDAEKVDKEIGTAFNDRKMVSPENIDKRPEIEKAAEKLKDDSFHYIDKNKNYAKDTDEYTNDDSSAKVIITKRTLVAKKMINKVMSEIDGIESNGNFTDAGIIDEGAQNVTLEAGTELMSKDPTQKNNTPKLNSSLQWKDCRKQKLFEHDPKPEDCRQKDIGDCWLQTSLIDILKKKGPKPIKDIFKDEGASGYVQIRLYYPKNIVGCNSNSYVWFPKYYRVPKKIPVDKLTGIPIYNGGALWVHYFEAAVAKSNIRNKMFGMNLTKTDPSQPKTKVRDYSSIDAGVLNYVWNMVFGNSVMYDDINKKFIDKEVENETTKKAKAISDKMWEKIDAIYEDTNLTQDEKEEARDQILDKYLLKSPDKAKIRDKVDNDIYIRIKDAINDNKLVGLDFQAFEKLDGHGKPVYENVSRGLVSGHAYAVCGYKEKDGIKYLRLINPWDRRTGRMYNKDNKKGTPHSFKGKKDESFKVKFSTIMKHLNRIKFEQ